MYRMVAIILCGRMRKIHLTKVHGEYVREHVDPNGTYYVVTDSYTSGYAYNNLTVIDTYTEGVYARDLLADHIAAGNL